MRPVGYHSGCCGYSDIIRGLAMPYNPVPIAIEQYEAIYADHDPMWIRERFKYHFQMFYGCDDAHADLGEYWADELIARGRYPLSAWDAVYERASTIAIYIASRRKVLEERERPTP